MSRNYSLIIGITAVLGILVISGCVQSGVKRNPTIKEIVDNPQLYEGKIVTVECKYGYWVRCQDCKPPAVGTKSEVCVYDETGCIYATGSEVLHANDGKKYLGTKFTLDEPLTLRAKVFVEDDGVAVLFRP